MRYIFSLLAIGLVCCALPAQAGGQFSAGVVPWSHDTDLEVQNATDFDGSNNTIDEAAKDWDMQGSGMAVRVAYEFPMRVSLYGEVGTSQTTVRDEDVTDPNLDVDSRGLDGGTYYGVGAQIQRDIGSNGKAFWSAGASFSAYSADLSEDVDTSWDYDETAVAVDGKAGWRFNGVGFYGGVRFVDYNADLDETDLSQLPGETFRTTELERDGDLDFLLGFESKGEHFMGFIELAVVGTRSAKAGLSFLF